MSSCRSTLRAVQEQKARVVWSTAGGVRGVRQGAAAFGQSVLPCSWGSQLCYGSRYFHNIVTVIDCRTGSAAGISITAAELPSMWHPM
mmetsp:Transcript_23286/g.51117  ORF Transcript_23286/g.51117 Transcript_23286/m.51117 type:complete len:88 (+) Transcript_23286:754-1017(+)